jgi:hypothetical protein
VRLDTTHGGGWVGGGGGWVGGGGGGGGGGGVGVLGGGGGGGLGGWGSMGSELAALPSPRSRTNTASAYIHLPLGPALLSAAAEPCTPTLACAVQVWTDVLNYVLLDDFRRARRERSAQCAERQTGDMDISTVILPPPFRLLAAETAHWDSHAHTHTHTNRVTCVSPPPPPPPPPTHHHHYPHTTFLRRCCCVRSLVRAHTQRGKSRQQEHVS